MVFDVPNAKKAKTVVIFKVDYDSENKSQVLFNVENMDDDRSVISSKTGPLTVKLS